MTRRMCKDFNFKVKSEPTPLLVPHKGQDFLPTQKPANVYEVLCTCGKVYFGETRRQLETHLKEHKDTHMKGFTCKSPIAEHARTEDHPIHLDDTRIQKCANQTMELGSNLHTNSTRELALQSRQRLWHTRLLNCHIQDDQQQSLCGPCPQDCIDPTAVDN